MELFVALVAGLITVVILWWCKSTNLKGNLKQLPGPWGLPILGYIPFLSSKPYLTFTELAKRYGNVYSVRLGSRNVVVLNDYQSTKEAFSQDVFIGRPPDTPFELNKETDESGAFFGLGWKEQRRFVLHMLRDLGLGRSKMEGSIQEEITALLGYLEKNENKPFCVREVLIPSVINNISSLIFGKKFKYDDPERLMISNFVTETSKAAGQVVWLIFFPWIRRILKFFNIEIDEVRKQGQGLKNYIKKEIEEHERTFNPDNIRDFIDAYILEIQQKKDDPAFTKPVLEDLAGAIFGGGSETVRQSVEWLLLLTASRQEGQRRIQSEIREVIGSDRFPEWLDQKSMPYTTAFIQEMLRWRTLIPINLLRYTLADTELNGYFIPKHSTILSNHWAIHHDPAFWGSDAEEFRPERFLDEKGNLKKVEQYVPFSTGKRACPGEPMAKVEVFLYFVSILQKFDVRLPEGKEADFEGELGIGLQIKAQDIVLTKRTS